MPLASMRLDVWMLFDPKPLVSIDPEKYAHDRSPQDAIVGPDDISDLDFDVAVDLSRRVSR